MGNTALTFWPEELGYLEKLPQEALDKMIIGIWANLNLDNAHFMERIKYSKGPTFHCVNKEIQKSAKEIYNVDATLVKAGKPTADFAPFKTISKISTLGLNGSPHIGEAWCQVKRPEMFKEIAEDSNCTYSFIWNSPEKDNKIYKDIDMYVCTSTYESGPAGIMECALSKIPVISTNTGHGKNIKSIKTFETVDEAVAIINELNSSPELLHNYIEEVYNEVIEEYDWSNVAPKYWIPLIDQLLNKS
jgi:glycosyltransferase involved in cell wall biosynthesis